MKNSFFFVISFITLITQVSANQIGEHSIGGRIGFSTSDFELRSQGLNDSVKGNLSGFSFCLNGNVNIFETQSDTFGIDLYSSFNGSPSLNDKIDGTEIEGSLYHLNSGIKPFFRSGMISPYLILGFSYSSFDLEEDGTSGWRKGTEFSPAIGFGASFSFTDSLVFNPSFLWRNIEIPSFSEDGTSADFGSSKTFKLDFPLTYKVSDHFSVGASISHTIFLDRDSSVVDETLGVVDKLDFSIQITSFMVSGDIIF